MKSLISINNYHYIRGGAEAVFLAHNEMFSADGWNVIPFCMHHENNLPSQWGDYFVDEIELGSDYGPLERARKSLRAIYSREAQQKIGALVDSTSPTIAHAHNIYHHISPSILSTLRGRGVPVVLTTHDLKIACPAYRMINRSGICERCKGGRIFNAALNRCMHDSLALSTWVSIEAYIHRFLGSYERYVNRFVVPSRFYLDKFVEWGWPSSKMTYIPNFIDANEIRRGSGKRAGFVYFGRLSHEKGIETLIRASALSGESVRVLGTGPDSGRLQELAVELSAPVEFVGFVSGEPLFEYLRSARAVVLPSEWYENAPISVLEAFAAGTPVIGAEIGGIPELITVERGRTYEAFSVTALAAAMNEISEMTDAELQTMGDAAREYVETTHSKRKYFDSCSSLYEEILDSV